MDLLEGVRMYVAKMDVAVSGSGGHAATFAVACALVKGFGLSIDQARPVLEEYSQRCDPPWSERELEHKLQQADTVPDSRPRGWLIKWYHEGVGSRPSEPCGHERTYREYRLDGPKGTEGYEPKPKAVFDPATLAQFARKFRAEVTPAWLADRSRVSPLAITSGALFLHQLYDARREQVLVFTEQQSQGQAIWPSWNLPTEGPDGVWFLAQPVDGKFHENPRAPLDEQGRPKKSRRSMEAVTSWRYLVLESDEAPARDWVAALVQLPLRIVAMYTSGGKSIHALVRIDAESKTAWDAKKDLVVDALAVMGADPKAMTAVRLTRLPGCLRGRDATRGKLQRLLYLCPDPPPKPICTLPRLRDTVAELVALVDDLEAREPEDRPGAQEMEPLWRQLRALREDPRAWRASRRLGHLALMESYVEELNKQRKDGE